MPITPDTRIGRIYFPDFLKSKKQWLGYKLGSPDSKGKIPKIPFYISGSKRSGTQGSQFDLDRLSTFEDAFKAWEDKKFDGIGFAILKGDGVSCIDIDAGIDAQLKADILQKIQSYTEISVSGKGLHVWVQYDSQTMKDNKIHLEFFSSSQFIAMTGKAIGLHNDVLPLSDENHRWLKSLIAPEKPMPITPEGFLQSSDMNKIQEALKYIDPDVDYNIWMRVGAAIHNELGQDGFFIFNEWSSGGAKYDPQNIRAKYASFAEIKGIGIGSLFHFAKEFGYESQFSWVHVKKNGRPLDTLENLKALLRHRGILCRHNVVKKSQEYIVPDIISSYDNREASAYAEIISLCKMAQLPTENTRLYLQKIADENQYSPVIEWINSRAWDGVKRLDSFLKTVKVADPLTLSSGEFFHEYLIKKWMIQAIAAAVEPKITALGVLVFQGLQGLGKTSWFKNLVPETIRAEILKSDSFLNPHDKDSKIENIAYWLVELGELNSTFNKSDIAALKSFFTSDFDELRKPYAPTVSKFGRKTVFFASVNDESFLVDETGNRRYWTVPTVSIEYDHNFDMQQVWAEVLELYKQGENYAPNKEAMAILNSVNSAHTVVNPIEEKLQSELCWNILDREQWHWMTATNIYIEIFRTKPTKADATKVSQWLRSKGIEFKNSEGKKYFIPPFQFHERLEIL